MSPLRSEPGVIEIEPADHGADIECGLHRIELKLSAGHLGAIGDYGSRNERAQQLGARRIGQRLQTASQGVQQAVSRRGVGFLAADLVAAHVVGDVD